MEYNRDMDKVQHAFRSVPRRDFLPPEAVDQASHDIPLPIGHGQTSSQPSTVRTMLDLLDVHPGQHVLDVGSGTGWTTALLSHLVGARGTVVAVERIPELTEFGRENCRRHSAHNVVFELAEHIVGWPKSAPYDRILVNAAAEELPQELLDQLAPGGKMVLPIHRSLWLLENQSSGEIERKEFPGYEFVPLVANY
jgi:protein-L-isoaspartate(D-aspartate) O-methyltransferase